MRLLPYFIIIPLLAAFLMPVLGRIYRKRCDLLANLAVLGTAVLSFFLLFALQRSGAKALVYLTAGWQPLFGLPLVVDGLSALMLVTVNLVALAAILYSVGYMEKYTGKWQYYTLFLLMLSGMNSVILSGDLFNLWVFFEVSSLASYILVAFGCESDELEASFKYMVLGTLGSLFILLGMAFLYAYTETLNMASLANVAVNLHGTVVAFVAVLFLAGFGLKSALVPFHAWLPDAHSSAPAPVSAMLSGVLIKALGIYSLVRILFNVLGAAAWR